MTKFEECIIHIGTDKTGTKTLQWFFARNRSNLSKNRIFYPKTFGKTNHFFLSTALCNINKISSRRKEFGLTQKHLIETFRNKILDSFRKEIQKERCTKLLISSESLYVNMNTIEEIKRLKNFLDEFVNKYKIIIYIRPQHEYQISAFSTRCLMGSTDKQILPGVKEIESRINYEKKIGMWALVFNDENVFPKIFARKEFLDENIKKDFISFLRLNWNDFEDTENKNQSISADAQRFLLELNQYLPEFIGNRRNPHREDLRFLISSTQKGKGLLPTRNESEDFFKIFTKSNESFRKKWFPERKELFEVDFTKYPEQVQQYQEIDSSFFKIFAELWTVKQKQITQLQKKIELE
ncbi:MAG: hypothetical protein OER82_04195 [Nitrosopumilus sp.]|nr:hypothetical protein [Nitrosopumilus sp.]